MVDVVTPRARTIILTDASTVIYSDALAAYDGTAATPTPSPTPTPAPSFSVLPSIEGTPKVGQTLAAMDGVILNATEVTRRWLLGSALKSTAATWVATSTGNLVLEVTATGPGGSVTETSEPVTVAEADTGAPTPGIRTPMKFAGQNLASQEVGYSGQGFPFLDRSKTSSQWKGGGWSPAINYAGGEQEPVTPVNRNGYPTAIPARAARVEVIINVEGPFGPQDKQIYVIETTRTDATIVLPNQRLVGDPQIVGGKLRIVFEVTGPTILPPSMGYGIYVQIPSLPTPFSDDDTFTCCRLDQEAKLKAGGIFTDEFVARVKDLGVYRMMDWDHTNDNYRYNFEDRPLPSWSSWNTVPLEIQIALCNLTNVPLHLCAPGWATDDHVRKLAVFVEARLKPGLRYNIEYSNEAWNYNFRIYNYLADNITPRIEGTYGDYSNRQYGYRMANVAAIFRKAAGYPDRMDFVWGTKYDDPTKTRAHLEGITLAMAQWADPASANPNAEFAARYDVVGKLLNILAPAGYIDGGLTFPSALDATTVSTFRATLKSWAQATDDSGLANAFRQIEFGDVLPPTNGTGLWNIAARTLAHMAIVEPLGVRLANYEGGYHLNADSLWPAGDPDAPLMAHFFTRISYDERSYGIYTKLFSLLRGIGVQYHAHLSDQGDYDSITGIWGVIKHAYEPLTPRSRAIVDFNAAPVAAPVLELSATTTGSYKTGASPVTTIKATGGVGRIIVTCNALPAGRVFNGFRTVRGKLTAVGTTTTRFTATDELGTTKYLDLVQEVTATPAGYRYWQFEIIGIASQPTSYPISAGAGLPSIAEIEMGKNDGTFKSLSAATISGDQRNDEPLPAIIDGNPATFYTGVGGKTNFVYLDLGPGDAYLPDFLRFTDRTENTTRAWGDFIVRASNDGATWVQVGRTIERGKTTPGNAIFNPDAFTGAYENHQFTLPMAYPA